MNFNPRSPDGERPCHRRAAWPRCYFNPRSPDGERLAFVHDVRCWLGISIHAPRMGSDLSLSMSAWFSRIFQSTLPGWGATIRRWYSGDASLHFNPRSPDGERPPDSTAMAASCNFNPRSPDGERLGCLHDVPAPVQISIHAPRMGSDRVHGQHDTITVRFQSTLPGWGATRRQRLPCAHLVDFNPRSPDGERRAA